MIFSRIEFCEGSRLCDILLYGQGTLECTYFYTESNQVYKMCNNMMIEKHRLSSLHQKFCICSYHLLMNKIYLAFLMHSDLKQNFFMELCIGIFYFFYQNTFQFLEELYSSSKKSIQYLFDNIGVEKFQALKNMKESNLCIRYTKNYPQCSQYTHKGTFYSLDTLKSSN